MTASEILQTLRKGDELTTQEICKLIDCSLVSVQNGIRRLLKDVSENIEYRPLTSEEKETRYGRKIGIRINVYRLNE
jgi:hypothetical protein